MRGWVCALGPGAGFVTACGRKAHFAKEALFSSDAPIHITIHGPMATLAAKRTGNPAPGPSLTAEGITSPITLTPRGITRLRSETCDFPPLRVEFTQPAAPGSLLDHQRRLKLVTHCRRNADFQQKVLLEYAAYRLYNLMTPQSFRARLLNVDYVDADGRPYISRVGFFIEDFERRRQAQRHDRCAHGSTVPLAQIDPPSGARFAVFEYMISNYDWAMRAGPRARNVVTIAG